MLKLKELLDLNYQDMNEAITAFGEKLSEESIGLFYYAGHGVQIDGENYLIPISSTIRSETEIKYKPGCFMRTGFLFNRRKKKILDVIHRAFFKRLNFSWGRVK